MDITTEVTMEVATEVRQLLPVMNIEQSKKKLMALLSLKIGAHFGKSYLVPALEAGLIEMNIPDKPKSRFQKYRQTEKMKLLK